MTISFTSFTYLLGSFVNIFLIYRLFQNLQKEKTVVSKVFFYFCLCFYLYILVTAIGTLFFVNKPEVLKIVVILATFFQSLGGGTIGYLIIHMRFPKISPWLGFWPIFILGLVAVVSAIITPFAPFLEKTGAVNWDYPTINKILRGANFLITLIPVTIIFFQHAISSSDPKVKKKAYLFASLFLATLFTIILVFFLRDRLGLGAIAEDITVLIAFFFVSILAFLSPRSESIKNV